MKCTATDLAHARNVRPNDFENRLRGYLAQLTPAELGQVAAEAQRKTVARLNRSAIAGRIKDAREESGLTQDEMALAMHVYKRTWQNYENVKKPRIPWDRIDDIAQITGKDSEWILHGHRETPDLMGVAHEDTVEGIRDEFRPYVDEILGEVRRNRMEIEQQNGLLATQSELLEKHRGVLEQQTELLRELREVVEVLPAIQAVLDALPPAETAPQPSERPASGTVEAPGVAAGRRRRTG